VEIKVTVRKSWYPENGEYEIVKRFAQVIIGRTDDILKKDSGYKWCLCSGGNDWFAEAQDMEHPEIWTISYRYGYGKPDMMKGLEVFLNWSMGR